MRFIALASSPYCTKPVSDRARRVPLGDVPVAAMATARQRVGHERLEQPLARTAAARRLLDEHVLEPHAAVGAERRDGEVVERETDESAVAALGDQSEQRGRLLEQQSGQTLGRAREHVGHVLVLGEAAHHLPDVVEVGGAHRAYRDIGGGVPWGRCHSPITLTRTRFGRRPSNSP
jgi:hypothetical protein